MRYTRIEAQGPPTSRAAPTPGPRDSTGGHPASSQGSTEAHPRGAGPNRPNPTRGHPFRVRSPSQQVSVALGPPARPRAPAGPHTPSGVDLGPPRPGHPLRRKCCGSPAARAQAARHAATRQRLGRTHEVGRVNPPGAPQLEPVGATPEGAGQAAARTATGGPPGGGAKGSRAPDSGSIPSTGRAHPRGESFALARGPAARGTRQAGPPRSCAARPRRNVGGDPPSRGGRRRPASAGGRTPWCARPTRETGAGRLPARPTPTGILRAGRQGDARATRRTRAGREPIAVGGTRRGDAARGQDR